LIEEGCVGHLVNRAGSIWHDGTTFRTGKNRRVISR